MAEVHAIMVVCIFKLAPMDDSLNMIYNSPENGIIYPVFKLGFYFNLFHSCPLQACAALGSTVFYYL